MRAFDAFERATTEDEKWREEGSTIVRAGRANMLVSKKATKRFESKSRRRLFSGRAASCFPPSTRCRRPLPRRRAPGSSRTWA